MGDELMDTDNKERFDQVFMRCQSKVVANIGPRGLISSVHILGANVVQ